MKMLKEPPDAEAMDELFGLLLPTCTLVSESISASPCDKGCEEEIVPEVTRHARSQMSRHHNDMMNRFLLTAVKERKPKIQICKRNNC